MKRWYAIGVAVLLGTSAGAWAETLDLDAMMILASNDSAPIDSRLERIEYQLRPLFRFEFYRHMGDSSATVAVPGSTTLALGDGHFLDVHLTDRGGKVRAEVRWYRGDEPLLSTAVNLHRGKTVILGGVPHGSGKLIVTLTPR